MKLRRLWIEGGPVDGSWQLPAQRAHYLRRVLRLRVDHEITLFDGQGRSWQARIASANASQLTLLETLPEAPPPALDTLLIQAVGRGERMDYALQKATELGVGALAPVITGRTEVRLSPERAARRREHWQGVIIQACEQSGRAHLPTLHPLMPLPERLQAERRNSGLKLALAPNGAPLAGVEGIDHTVSRVVMLVGPEGGLTDQEMALARSAGFEPTRLGPRVLRTETAGPAALAAVQTLWGDFRT